MTINVADWVNKDPAEIFEYFQDNYSSNNVVIRTLFDMQAASQLGKGQLMPLLLLCLAEQVETGTRELRTARMLQAPGHPVLPLKAKVEAWQDVQKFIADNIADISSVNTFCDTRILGVRELIDKLGKATEGRDSRG